MIKCAKAYSYVETLGKYADSLHIYVKDGYEVDFKREFEREVRLAIKKLRIVYAEIAFDITYEPFRETCTFLIHRRIRSMMVSFIL